MKGRKAFYLIILIICLLLAGAIGVLTNEKPGDKDAGMAALRPRIVAGYAKLPLFFEPNRGQTDSEVKFLSRGRGYTLFLTPSEAVLSLRKGEKGKDSDVRSDARPAHSTLLRMKLVGANPEPKVAGQDALPGKSNYFHGNDPGKWLTQVPHYARVKYEDVYPGIDLVYYGTERHQLEYDFVVSPGADPQSIRLEIEGAGRMTLNDEGALLLRTSGGEVAWQAPFIYQEISGSQKAVDGGYLILAENQVAFSVGEYDEGKPLVIDPTLSYATYLGGSGDDGGTHIAADSSGNAYVTGTTSSADFPTLNPAQGVFGGGSTDIFVTKLNADGSALTYSTFLGGSNREFSGGGIAVDESGSAYITGTTASTDFPLQNEAQVSLKGLQDAFVTKLSADGSSLVYSTYLGGSGSVENGRDIVVDDSGNAYVTGFTDSIDFPTVNPPFQNVNGGGRDAFVTKLNPNGTSLVYSTYLGGTGDDGGEGIAVDSSRSAYIAGDTSSNDFPTLNAPQGSLNGSQDAFVTKLSTDGASLVFSTYLGGSDTDRGHGVAVDVLGNAYLTGITSSLDFPTLNPVQVTLGGGVDAFVTKLNLNGTALEYSTYLGGSNDETGPGNIGNIAIAVDTSASAYVAGTTSSPNFPLANELQAIPAGSCNAFVTKYSTDGAALAFSTYLGGGACDLGESIALDASGIAYVTGNTSSTDFPTTVSPLQGVLGGVSDAFVAKIFTDFSLAIDAGSQASATVSPGETATYDLILTPDGFSGTISLSCDGQPTGATCLTVPDSIALDGTNTETFRVSVTTTAPALVVPPMGQRSRHPWPLVPALFLAMLGLAEAARRGGAFHLPGGVRRATVVMGVTLLFAILSVSCRNNNGAGIPPTPPGTSTLTISATSGGVTRTIDLTLVVN